MDVFDIRRKNLRQLIQTRFDGNQSQFAEAVSCKPPQINRWISTTTSDHRNITEKSARSIEEKLELTGRWLDIDHTQPEDSIAALLSTLPTLPDSITDSIQSLVLRYQENHEEGERIAQAIQALAGTRKN